MPEHSDRQAGPRTTPEADAAKVRRLAREAAALRANLQRRKQQARARVTDATDGAAERTPEGATQDATGEATAPCR